MRKQALAMWVRVFNFSMWYVLGTQTLPTKLVLFIKEYLLSNNKKYNLYDTPHQC